MSTIRRFILGCLLVGTIGMLAACGSTSTTAQLTTHPATAQTTAVAPKAAPVIRKYTADWLQAQMTGTTNSDGTTTRTSSCVDSVVQPDGSGSYECFATYSDSTSGTGQINVTPDGSWHTAGTSTPPSTSAASTRGATVGDPASVNQWLLDPLNATGTDFVTTAQCKDGPVDASGTEAFSCYIVFLSGSKGTGEVDVSKTGAVHVPG